MSNKSPLSVSICVPPFQFVLPQTIVSVCRAVLQPIAVVQYPQNKIKHSTVIFPPTKQAHYGTYTLPVLKESEISVPRLRDTESDDSANLDRN